MIRPIMRHAVAGSTLPALALHGIPWWGAIILVSLGPLAYICRQYLLYKLANKALDKSPSNQVSVIIAAVTGQPSAAKPEYTGSKSGRINDSRAAQDQLKPSRREK